MLQPIDDSIFTSLTASPGTNGEIACVLTPAGRGAVACIGILCTDATADLISEQFFQAANQKTLSQQKPGQLCFGHWADEEVVVCRGSTGEQGTVYEINCHGGPVAIARIRDQLQTLGIYRVDHVTWLQQTQNRLASEYLPLLINASTSRLSLLIEQQHQRLIQQLKEWREQLSTSSETTLVQTQIAAGLQFEQLAHRMQHLPTLVIVGRPNVGKSSLMNLLLGFERVIVFDQPGTTRDAISVQTAFGGWPVELLDTAGLRETTDDLERQGIQTARQRMETADLKLILIDLSTPPAREDLELLELAGSDSLVVGNKADLPDNWGDQFPKSGLRISCQTSAGLAELTDWLGCQLEALFHPEGIAQQAVVPLTLPTQELFRQIDTALRANDRSRAIELITPWIEDRLSASL